MSYVAQIFNHVPKADRFSRHLFSSIKRYIGRNFSVISDPQNRVVYVYKTTTEPKQKSEDRHPINEYAILKEFRKHTSDIRFIDKRKIRESLEKPEKAVLVIPGGRLTALTDELTDFVSQIREMIQSGNWNYFGVNAAAVYAGHEVKNGNDELVRINNSFLSLANFRANGFPYLMARKLSKDRSKETAISVRYDDKYRIKVRQDSGPCLEITQGEKVARLMQNSTVQKIGEYADRNFTNSLGVAALLGTSGEGRFFVSTHILEEDNESDLLNESVGEVCLEDEVSYAMGKLRLNSQALNS